MRNVYSFYSIVALLLTGIASSVPVRVNAAALTMKTSCYLEKKEGATIQGEHLGELFEVASVSKLFTSYWAVASYGPNYRFQTRFHVTPVGEKTSLVDLHIEGSGDPFFSREQFYVAIAELNKLKIQRVRNLTFDENFMFLQNPRSDHANEDFWGGQMFGPNVALTSLKPILANIRSANNQTAATKWEKSFYPTKYSELRLKVKAQSGVELPYNIYLAVAKLEHLPKASFSRQDSTVSYAMASLPMHRILKEINRSSNNRAAEIVFNGLGGKEKFKEFLEAQLGLDEEDVAFVNGSGYPDVLSTPKVYNKATCESVIAVVAALDQEMEKSQLLLADVVSVSNPGPADEQSTISSRYGVGDFRQAVVAKTGSVDPVVSLAGVLHTEQGEIYFSHIHGTKGRTTWKTGRNGIFAAMKALLLKFGGQSPIDYAYVNFPQVDASSAFVELKNVALIP